MSHPPIDTLERMQAAGPPLSTDAWSLGDRTLRIVLGAIDAGARTIVELGSGRSTVILARLLRELGEGGVNSLEHDPGFAARTREQLAAERLDRARVVDAPLEPHPLAGESGAWYALGALAMLPGEIDLLLIDGPPAGEPELRQSRHPALAELGPRFAAGAVIVLDDAGRPGERDAVALWEAQHPVHFEVQAESEAATARWQVYVAPSGARRRPAHEIFDRVGSHTKDEQDQA